MIINYIVLFIISFSSLLFSQTINVDKPINAIKFEGAASKKVLDAIETISFKTLTNTTISEQKLNLDIQTLYQTGFFSNVSATSSFKDEQHILLIRLIENPLVQYIAIKTKNQAIETIIFDSFSLLLNSPLNAVTIEHLKQVSLNKAKKAGFDFLDFEHIIFDKSSQTLTITLTEAIIESITFLGLNNIKKDILLREMDQKKGSTFNSIDLRKDREKLVRLGYFNSISPPQFSIGSAPNRIKILFNVIEKKLNKISVGIEQDLRRYYGFISHKRHNFLINSDVLSLKTQLQVDDLSLNLNRYSFIYTQPWFLNRYNASASIGLYNLEKQEVLNNQTTRSLRQGHTLGVKIPLSNYLSINPILKLENISQQFESDNIDPYSIHSLEMIMLYEAIDNHTNPKQGNRFNINIEQGNHLGLFSIGGLSFTRLSSSLSYYYSLSSRFILATRLKGGIFYPIKEVLNTYENEYFILGGSRSLRGYDESLSPFSGRRHILANLELRYSLSSSLQPILFLDYGNTFNHKLDIASLNLGYGIGFRYYTPIGPIRVDFAKGKSTYFIHLGLGHIF